MEDNKEYRIGNIIVHEDEDNNTKNIVDGQQRLTTISLLLKHLNFKTSLLNQNYKHKISKYNIVCNYKIIDNWLKLKFENDETKRVYFKQQILKKCNFVLFTVYHDDEAFQLFDSQNARGKELEPHDLLKAFHLREMKFDTEDDRIKCVERWEKSNNEKELKPILGNHLFRIRKWSKNERKYDFTKSDIDEFKGISLHQPQKYPFEKTLRMLDGFVENAQNDKFLKNLHVGQSFPFSITMPIINGKRFFEYVDFYIHQRKILFDQKENSDFLKFYNDYCIYDGWQRIGDQKISNMYENIIISFIDKFGIENFKNFYVTLYKVVYVIRCNNPRIRIESILNSEELKIFREINDAISQDNLKKYRYKTYYIEKEDTQMVKGVVKIKNFINGGENNGTN